MVAIKPAQLDATLARLPARIDAILVYGGDQGAITEAAQKTARTLAEREKPPGEVVRIDEADLEADPDRLAVTLQTMPMFSGRSIVRTSTSRRVNAQTLKPLMSGPPFAGILIVEAGSLAASDALRVLFEKSERGATIPCYGDNARDLGQLVTGMLSEAGLAIDQDARDLLISRLGADRSLSRAEVEKLIVYCREPQRKASSIIVEDIDAIVGDASEQTMERAASAAASGEAGPAMIACDRAIAAGEQPQGILAVTQRYFDRLDRLRTDLDGDASFEDAMRQMRPPVSFRQRDLLQAQSRLWTAPRLRQARREIAEAVRSARLSAHLQTAITERLLLRLATVAKVSGSRRPPHEGSGAGAGSDPAL